ncbi:hypothetical protein B7494_g5630 [Chlorociboria aeruginascens]|nr:hypothetical protein B7494_g5630 [Chlorociboria aeruginascens]
MADTLYYETPTDWISKRILVPRIVFNELQRREGKPLSSNIIPAPELSSWSLEIFYARALRRELKVPHDCVYCSHNTQEAERIEGLSGANIQFQFFQSNNKLNDLNYDKYTEIYFWATKSLLAWESIFPEGIDMEALSPRDVNAHMRAKQPAAKPKTQPPKLMGKEKDHPPAPPAEVHEPPSSDRKNGAIYKTGGCLGKGGFAICYEGRLSGTKQIYALKIVKSQMPQKKMEQKFQTELQIHSKMHHPNIVQFHRAFSYEKCTYIVLELCPNGSLMDMVKQRKYVTEPEVRFWTVQMAGAIKYMHARGIIHRDLKMGNIFLDNDMNVKIGDFGLAALFMSDKDISACRRTTLCGTPNYIAPEILEKGKGGHDHAVDIWSLGIIIFAMLTGKPPFQSTTQDEIYRRARERDYDWPKLNTSENFISEETKDLVSGLLQDPKDRPDPDTIVQHPFFTCGWMPQSEEMTPDLRDNQPNPSQFLSLGMRAGRSNIYMRNLKKLCIKCEVGPWDIAKKHRGSTYKEVAAEEKVGLTPAVPLPEDVVYRPFAEWLKEQVNEVMEVDENSKLSSVAGNKILEPVSSSRMNDQTRASTTRAPVQSFAAQQRTRAPPPTSSRGTIKSRRPVTEAKGEEQPKRVESKSRGMLSIPSRRKAERRISEIAGNVEERLAADLAEQLQKAEVERKSQEEKPMSFDKPLSIFSPEEKLEYLSGTKPDSILDGLRRLQTELERALNSRSTAVESGTSPISTIIVVKWVDYTNRFGAGYILSNGSIGCVFKQAPAIETDPSDGYTRPSCLIVRDAERHLQNRTNEAYIDRHQVVPISGPSIEFYENKGEQGIWRGKVSPQKFKLVARKDGEGGCMAIGDDEWGSRKRENIILWRKFANYMFTFGRDQDYPHDEAVARSDSVAAGNIVTFYQRFGDVGCWGFSDGHFQVSWSNLSFIAPWLTLLKFNFPDHTKVLISADGTWCDFYHLPLEAARELSQNGTISAAALDDRQRLSYPLQTLLNFMAKPTRPARTTRKRPEIDPMIQGIPQANDFRRKVEFIKAVVKEWVANGGLGNSNLDPKVRLKWIGHRELVNVKVPYKHVWTTIGARNGDGRKVAWFDPKTPEAILHDIE